MQFDTSMIGTLNAGLAFGIFFMIFVVIFVAYTRKRTPIKRSNEGVSSRVIVRRKGSVTKDIAVLGLLFFATAIVFGVLFVGYIVEARNDGYDSQRDIANEQLKQKLKDTMLTIDLMSAQSETNQYQLDLMKHELEDAYTSLNTRKSRSRTVFVPIVPGPLY